MIDFLHHHPITSSNIVLLATTASFFVTSIPVLQFFGLLIGACIGSITLFLQIKKLIKGDESK